MFHTSKPGSFKSLRRNFYYDTVTLKLIEEKIQCEKRVEVFIQILLMIDMEQVLKAPGPADILETQAKSCNESL